MASEGGAMAVLPVNQFSLLVGASGSGKTTLILQAWYSHERHEPFVIGFPPHIERVAYIAADRTKEEPEERAAYLQLKNIEFYGITDDEKLNYDLVHQPRSLWDRTVQQFKHPFQMMIVDPIALFVDGNLNDFKHVAITLMRWNRYCKQSNITMLGLHHTTKQRADNRFLRPQDRVSGSGAFPGYSGTQCVLVEGIEDGLDYEQLIIIPHKTPKEYYSLNRRRDGYFTVREIEAQGTVMRALQAEGYLRFVDFCNIAAASGLDMKFIEGWLQTDPKLQLDGDYVTLQK